jgi:hypothetical protein
MTLAPKRCIACRETKPLDDYYVVRKAPDCRASTCRRCAIAEAWGRRYRKVLERQPGIDARTRDRLVAAHLAENAERIAEVAANPRGPYTRHKVPL